MPQIHHLIFLTIFYSQNVLSNSIMICHINQTWNHKEQPRTIPRSTHYWYMLADHPWTMLFITQTSSHISVLLHNPLGMHFHPYSFHKKIRFTKPRHSHFHKSFEFIYICDSSFMLWADLTYFIHFLTLLVGGGPTCLSFLIFTNTNIF